MSPESIVEVLRAYLAKEGLVLCRFPDTQFAITGMRETVLLRELAVLVEDALSVGVWVVEPPGGEITQEIPAETVQMLRALSISQ